MFRMVSDVNLCRLVQSTFPSLLSGIYLHDYGFSLRNVPGPDQSGIHDGYQGDSDRESGVEAAALQKNNYGIAMR